MSSSETGSHELPLSLASESSVGSPSAFAAFQAKTHSLSSPGLTSPALSIRSGDKAKQKGGIGGSFIKDPSRDNDEEEIKIQDPQALARRARRGATVTNLMVLVVLLDTFCTCTDIDARATENGQPPEAITILADICLGLYALELIVVMWLRGWQTLKEFSTQTDLFIIGCGLTEKVLSLLWDSGDNTLTSLVRVLRLIRIFRITRLLQRTKALRELSKLVSMMTTCLKALMWSFIFCFVIMTIWAMLMVEFVHPLIQQLDESYGTFAECPHCTRATSSVMRANLLLFKTVIAGDSWGEIAVPVIEQFPLTAIVFMGSLLTLVFGVLNLIVAVVVDTFAEARQRDVIHLAEDLEVDLANDQVRLQRMFERIDEDGSGLVSYEELLAGARKDPEFQSRLRVMDIDEADLRQLFDMIDSTGEGEIESSEFIAALSRWVHDSKTAPRFVKYNMLRSLEMQEELQFVVQEQFDILSSRLEHSFIALERTMMENSHFGRISASQTLEQFRQCVGASPQPQEDEETKPPSSPQDAELPEQPHASLIPVTLATPKGPQTCAGTDASDAEAGRVEMLRIEALMATTEIALKRSLANLEHALQGLHSAMPTSNQTYGLIPTPGMNSVESSRQVEPFQQRHGLSSNNRESGRASIASSTPGRMSRTLSSSRRHSARNPREEKPTRTPVGTFGRPGTASVPAGGIFSLSLRRPSMFKGHQDAT